MTRTSRSRPSSADGRAQAEGANGRRRLAPLLPLLAVVVVLAACAPATLAPEVRTFAWSASLPSSPSALRADFVREARRAGWEREPTQAEASERAVTRVERCGWLGIGTYVETLQAQISFVPLGAGGTLATLTLDPVPEAVAFGATVRGALGGTWTASVETRDPASPSRRVGGSASR